MDRPFDFQLGEDPTMSRIIAAVVELAHALEVQVISGASRPPNSWYCSETSTAISGRDYFARPLPPEETLELLRSWRTLNLIRSSSRTLYFRAAAVV